MLETANRTAPASLDVEAVRADFPILATTVYDRPLVYLDNAASAQKPRAVIDAVAHAYEAEYANVHRGLHFLSNRATENYEAARETARRFLNARSADEIIFTKNATEALNLVAQSFGGEVIGEGDEIVLTIMEHHSNIVPWHFHRERRGAVIRWAPVTDAGELDLDALAALIGPRTKIVAVTHMSNVLGTVTPIAEIVRIAHGHGVPVVVDGSQGAVHTKVDVQDLGVDFYAMTGHKLYGPSVWPLRAPEEDAALSGRRRDDPGGVHRPDHLWRPAPAVRGRNAAHRSGDWPRGRPRLYRIRGTGRDHRP
jgi:cysteine desulfurase/selenocysteine lyase